MNLNELRGVRAHYDKNFDEVADSAKWTRLGAGSNAVVFENPQGVAYKFWTNDSAYEDYVDFVKKNKGNRWLPKFKSPVKELTSFFKRSVNFPKKVKYVKLEKLAKADLNQKLAPGIELVPLLTVLERWAESGAELDFRKLEAELFGPPALAKRHYPTAVTSLDSPKVQAEIRELYELVEQLTRLAVTRGHKVDLHVGNIMLRGSQPVFIDMLTNSADRREAQRLERAMELALRYSVGVATGPRTRDVDGASSSSDSSR